MSLSRQYTRWKCLPFYLSVYADEGILETPRLAGPDPVVQFRVEITRRNVVCSFDYNPRKKRKKKKKLKYDYYLLLLSIIINYFFFNKTEFVFNNIQLLKTVLLFLFVRSKLNLLMLSDIR